jgi:hypothetical protein
MLSTLLWAWHHGGHGGPQSHRPTAHATASNPDSLLCAQWILSQQIKIRSNQIKGAAAASFDSFLGHEIIES